MSLPTVAAITLDPADDETPTAPEQTDAQRAAAGLRQLADLLDANPDLHGTEYAFRNINVFQRDRADVVEWARAAKRTTGKVDKFQTGNWAGVRLEFGAAVRVDVTIEREEICERVVVGQKPEMVPDPEALAAVPRVERLVDVVEWRCGSLLAPDAEAPLHAGSPA